LRIIRIVLVAAAVAGVALVGTAAPAAAVFGPQAVSTSISSVRISCTGDTVPGTAEVTTSAPVDVVVTLLMQSGGGFVDSGRTTTFRAVPGTTSYSYDLNVAGLPLDVREYRVRLVSGSARAQSNAVSARRCAPDAVVPEVPSAVLLPLSLSCTALVVLAVRRRRDVPSA
jgi:hypothetical protein